MGDDITARDVVDLANSYCSSRPQYVKDLCGSTCVTSWKFHANSYGVKNNLHEVFLDLLKLPNVYTVVTKRDYEDNFCSVQKSYIANLGFGHNPEQHRVEDESMSKKELKWDCKESLGEDYKSKLNQYTSHLDIYYKDTLNYLKKGRDKSQWMEMDFDEYVTDPEAAHKKLLAFAGLGWPPEEWRKTCTVDWCTKQHWPTVPYCHGGSSPPSTVLTASPVSSSHSTGTATDTGIGTGTGTTGTFHSGDGRTWNFGPGGLVTGTGTGSEKRDVEKSKDKGKDEGKSKSKSRGKGKGQEGSNKAHQHRNLRDVGITS